MNPLQQQYLSEIGIDVWIARERESEPDTHAAAQSRSQPVPVAEQPAPETASMGWDELRAAVGKCTACALHSGRTQTVFGVGDTNARLLVIGEAPGADEDLQGEPFVGRAGQLLNAMLRSIGLARERVFIANILKCRPPGNRDPKREESETCTPFLARQIELLKPQAVLALGRISAQWLLESQLPVGRLRGQIQTLKPWDVPLIVSYHPAYLLRSPAAKGKAWEDLLLVRELLGKE